MEIQKDTMGKWIRPQYGNYLSNASATDDKQKVIVSQAYIPNEESNDEWVEITQEDVERIRKAKGQTISVEIPEEVNTQLELTAVLINTIELTNERSLQFKSLYPKWESFIGKSLEANFKIQYNDRLYKVRQKVNTVLDQDGYRPGESGSEALYEEINEVEAGGNAGTLEDPIPYNNNMELFNGKYYSQNGSIYKCTRDTGQAVYHDLESLVGIYVEKVEQ